MKIKNVSCTQFAGVMNRDISFTDGINVVYGKNESGKSTLANLISRTLFQNAHLDRRSDKAFMDLYFPCAKKDGKTLSDFVDGKITVEAENGTYTLSKEWGVDARCTLVTPDGVLRDPGTIDEILKEILLYGEGVYADMLLSSQRNTDLSLQSLLDAADKTAAKQELTDVVSKAFAESDGVSIDAIEQAIQAKIADIAGSHWDFEREAPVRKTGRWANGLGEILKTYYALEDAKNKLEEISQHEAEAEKTALQYLTSDAETAQAEEAFNTFNTFAARLTVQSERKKAIERIEYELSNISKVLSAWPTLSENLEKAKALQAESKGRKVFDLWNMISALRAECTAEDAATAKLPKPDAAELADVKKLQREITLLENKLCGMNLTAAIQMLGGHTTQITSLRTGEAVDISGGIASITEAVKITVPGVMEMQLSPADVDVSLIEAQIAGQKQKLSAIFEKYGVTDMEALELYTQKIETARAKAEAVDTKIARLLGDTSEAELEANYKHAGMLHRPEEEIERDITSVSGGLDLATFITKSETIAGEYARTYGSVNDLKAKAFDLSEELKKAQASVSDTENIPAEYQNISDPDAHLEALQNALKAKQALRDEAFMRKSAAASKLDAFKEANPDACTETVEKAQRIFDETKSLLGHWLHIEEVFKAAKENIRDNPMQDIADNFTRYLGIISDGRISSEFPEADKLNMHIYSGNNLLDYGKLSEGTKETVSLAFRLAVLDHLFPEGGVLVLDDPFTDMDTERTAQACALIKDCANRHQIVFLTCKEEYISMLGGNTVRI